MANEPELHNEPQPPQKGWEAGISGAEPGLVEHVGAVAVAGLSPNRSSRLWTRRRVIAAGLGGLVAVAASGAWVRHQANQLARAQQSVRSMLLEEIGGMPTNDQFRALVAQCGGVEINLDEEQRIAGDASSALVLYEAMFGTSNGFRRGLDGPGESGKPKPFNQPNAISQIAANSLERQALDTLRILEIITRVLAHPGAYSGDGPYPNSTFGANDSFISGQLNFQDQRYGYSFQRELRQVVAKPIMRYEGGYDDYRVLFASVAQLADRLSDVTRLATSNSLDRDMQREVQKFLGDMDGVAAQFGRNLIAFADNLNQANEDRLQNGLMRITLETVFTWNFIRQRYFPFGAIDGDNSSLLNNPLLRGVMQRDPTGPPELNRYMVDIHAIPGGIGPMLAFIAWGKIVDQQIAALKTIRTRYPLLHRAITDLIDLNQLPEFYRSQQFVRGEATSTADPADVEGEYTVVLDEGDGHPGGVEGKRAGAELAALESLKHRKRDVNGQQQGLDEYSKLRDQSAA